MLFLISLLSLLDAAIDEPTYTTKDNACMAVDSDSVEQHV